MRRLWQSFVWWWRITFSNACALCHADLRKVATCGRCGIVVSLKSQ